MVPVLQLHLPRRARGVTVSTLCLCFSSVASCPKPALLLSPSRSSMWPQWTVTGVRTAPTSNASLLSDLRAFCSNSLDTEPRSGGLPTPGTQERRGEPLSSAHCPAPRVPGCWALTTSLLSGSRSALTHCWLLCVLLLDSLFAASYTSSQTSCMRPKLGRHLRFGDPCEDGITGDQATPPRSRAPIQCSGSNPSLEQQTLPRGDGPHSPVSCCLCF